MLLGLDDGDFDVVKTVELLLLPRSEEEKVGLTGGELSLLEPLKDGMLDLIEVVDPLLLLCLDECGLDIAEVVEVGLLRVVDALLLRLEDGALAVSEAAELPLVYLEEAEAELVLAGAANSLLREEDGAEDVRYVVTVTTTAPGHDPTTSCTTFAAI